MDIGSGSDTSGVKPREISSSNLIFAATVKGSAAPKEKRAVRMRSRVSTPHN
jgi:hypothetical protein